MKLMFPETKHGRVSPRATGWFDYHGWPTVCKDERGVLYATASAFRMSHVCPAGKNAMYISYNEGKTWSPPIIVNDTFADDRDMGILYLGNGKLLVSWFSVGNEDFYDHIQGYDWFGDAHKAITKGFGTALRDLPPEEFAKYCGSFVKISNDYGITWSDPIRVPVTAPHGPCVCKDGTIVYLGNRMGRPEDEDENKRPPVTACVSKDGGYTWEIAGKVPDGDIITSINTFEPHVTELPNGRLLGAIRVHCNDLDPFFTVFTTYSDDKGVTWSKPVCIGVDGSPPHLLVHSSGAVICSYSRRTNGIRSQRAVVSYDNGETWTEDYTINDQLHYVCDMGYPASVELSDGSILTVYYQKAPGEGPTSVLCTTWRLGDNAGGDEALEAFLKLDAEMKERRKIEG